MAAGPYVPRDKLLKLITYATNSEAVLVHVDVNLTRPINPDSNNLLSKADQALGEFLKEYSAESKKSDAASRRRPLLILNRELQPTGNDADDCQEVRPSFLDQYVIERRDSWNGARLNLIWARIRRCATGDCGNARAKLQMLPIRRWKWWRLPTISSAGR